MSRSRLTPIQIPKYMMASEGEKESQVINPFLNPLAFWRRYLINFITANRAYYENAIRLNEYWTNPRILKTRIIDRTDWISTIIFRFF